MLRWKGRALPASCNCCVESPAATVASRRQFVAGAVSWADRLRAEFDEAFPDEIPPSQRGEGATAA